MKNINEKIKKKEGERGREKKTNEKTENGKKIAC